MNTQSSHSETFHQEESCPKKPYTAPILNQIGAASLNTKGGPDPIPGDTDPNAPSLPPTGPIDSL